MNRQAKTSDFTSLQEQVYEQHRAQMPPDVLTALDAQKPGYPTTGVGAALCQGLNSTPQLEKPTRYYASVALRRDDGTYLVIHHTKKSDHPWRFPGGKIDDGETPGQAAIRELREELGIEGSTFYLIDAHTTDVDGGRWTGYYFLCTGWLGEPAIQEPEKQTCLAWLTAAQLKAPGVNSFPEQLVAEKIDDKFSTAARLHETTDAAVWASEFKKIHDHLYGGDIDEGWMIGWFANAIETARTAGAKGRNAEFDEVTARLKAYAQKKEQRVEELQRVVDDFSKSLHKLVDAIHGVYYAAHWTSDRLDKDAEEALWTKVREAAGFTAGNAPRPAVPFRALKDCGKTMCCMPGCKDCYPERKSDGALKAKVDAFYRPKTVGTHPFPVSQADGDSHAPNCGCTECF